MTTPSNVQKDFYDDVENWTRAYRNGFSDALGSIDVRNALRRLDSDDLVEVSSVVISFTGLFMPLAGKGMQIAHNAVSFTVNEIKNSRSRQIGIRNASNAQKLSIEMMKLFDRHWHALIREIRDAEIPFGPLRESFTAPGRNEVLQKYFRTEYINREHDAYYIKQAKIKEVVSRKLIRFINDWMNIPERCRLRLRMSEAQARARERGRSVVDRGDWSGARVDSQRVAGCIERERNQLKRQLTRAL